MKKHISPVQETAAVPRFQFVETGPYRNISNGVYFERPSLKGRRTWRSLDTANLKHAREELYRRRAGVRAVEVEKAKAAVTVGDMIRHYLKDGYPDRQKQPRVGRTLELEKRNCSVLLKFWDKVPATEICLVECDRYHAWRRKHATKGRGDRAVDMEMNTLSNAILWAMRCDLIRQNPLNFRRPRYCCAKNVRHCREFMPHDTEALHEIAALMFSDMDGEMFLAWVQQGLATTWQPNDLVIMDNLATHKVVGVREALEAVGTRLLYLPPYAPDFNPIENRWSKIKQRLRSLDPRTNEELLRAAATVFAAVSPPLATASLLTPNTLYHLCKRSSISFQ